MIFNIQFKSSKKYMKIIYRVSILWKWALLFFIIVSSLLSIVVIWGGGWGLKVKTLWDWLQLLIIPAVLALGAWWLKREESKLEKRMALEVERKNLIATYFDRLQELLLEYNLKDRTKEEIIEIARARTLQVLRNLDGQRKGHVIRFLVDTGVLAQKDDKGRFISYIRLSYADLSNAYLENVHLEGVNLWCANLENANLKNAHLNYTNLSYAFMKGTIFEQADLSGANLEKTIVEPIQLINARSLKNAVMPDGLVYERWLSKAKPDWSQHGMPQIWTAHESR